MALAWLVNLGFAGGGAVTPPTPVPDVVGETQAAGTAILEGDGFVVAVVTAYSSVVAAGLIISQDPIAGSTPGTGATVTITVSLGDAPVVVPEEGGGGYGFYFDSAREIERRRRRKEKERQDREEAEEIPVVVDREIAKLLKAQEAKDEERKELARVQALADKHVGTKMKEAGVPTKIRAAVLKAHEERTFSALQQLARLMDEAQEEEELAVILLLLLNDE